MRGRVSEWGEGGDIENHAWYTSCKEEFRWQFYSYIYIYACERKKNQSVCLFFFFVLSFFFFFFSSLFYPFPFILGYICCLYWTHWRQSLKKSPTTFFFFTGFMGFFLKFFYFTQTSVRSSDERTLTDFSLPFVFILFHVSLLRHLLIYI